MERFFSTLKAKLDRLAVESFAALNQALGEFRFFYNQVQPHQNLAGLTPAESWSGAAPFAHPAKREYWFEGSGWAAQRLLLAEVTTEPVKKTNTLQDENDCPR